MYSEDEPTSDLGDELGAEASSPPPALLVRDFSRAYDDTVAVEDLSFDVRPGEILGLVGPNGAGKTTTLRSIVGVLPLQEGEVVIAGHDLRTDEVGAKSCLAWVPDDPQPFDTLSVEEHLEFTANLYRCKRWRHRADELLSRFDLQEKRKALGGELSRGMRQKLAFSCAWLPRPRVVLMDEPLSGLDPRGIRSAKDAILSLTSDGAAVVLSSHLLELIEELADRLLILDRGKRIFLGTLEEARRSVAADAGSSLEEIFMVATGTPRDEESSEAGGS
jgi:ABC-2 type transport system ATP-binding protein